mgnify:CR=1 FL=1
MRKLTYQEVKEYIEGFGYKLLSEEYIKSGEKLLMKCPEGHECYITFNKFQQGRRCPKCSNNTKYTYEFVKKYIESFDYQLLSDEYINNKTNLTMRCKEGHIFKTTFSSFKNLNTRCPYCANNVRYSYDYIKEYIETFDYKLLSKEYINANTLLSMQCSNGHNFEMRYSNFQQGNRCPICNISKGERKIIDWLKENEIVYIYDEPYFKDLLSPLGNPLRPDFILPDYKIWIEYDGEFHYNKMYNNDGYEALIVHDEIKNKYAKENGWKLIRIPYWEFDNIEEILKRELEL